MANYYLDIETTGKDPSNDKIITVQYQQVDPYNAKPIGKLKILKEWELGEEKMLKKFTNDSGILDENYFTFVPIGFNLTFEHKFLLEKSKKYKLGEVDVILNRPFIDLKPIAVIMKGGSFRDSGLDKITEKPVNGSYVPQWYSEGEYKKIINYIKIETREFLKLAQFFYQELPKYLIIIKKKKI